MRRDVNRIVALSSSIGIACLVAFACCHSAAITPATPSVVSERTEKLPFMASDLSGLPQTWYCLSPWSGDLVEERKGVAVSAWRLFISLNWTGEFREDNEGRSSWAPDVTMNELGGAKYPRWSSWHTPQTLRTILERCSQGDPPPPPRPDWAHHPDSLDPRIEIALPGRDGDATSVPPCVYDQNGEMVEYEIRMSPKGWVSNLYEVACPRTPESEVAVTGSGLDASSGGAVTFQYGQCRGQGGSDGGDVYDRDGAVAIKLAWKVLSGEERRGSRYLQRTAVVRESCDDNAKAAVKTLGLVGFHITQKTNHYPGWIWSTFEHVNNLTPAEGAAVAAFHDPRCKDCVANTSQRLGADSRCRTQITRVAPIPDEIANLNREFRSFLRGRSVLQHYELVGVQYVPSAKTQATPAELRNSVIETYNVSRPVDWRSPPKSCADLPRFEASSCLGCHRNGSDFSFVPKVELCNCKDQKNRWVGNRICDALGLNHCHGEASL